MFINWLGQSCFKIQGENVILITDPLDDSCGLKMPKTSADIITLSADQASAKLIKGTTNSEPFIIGGPGEYEFRKTFIYGINVSESKDGEKKNRNIAYKIEIDGIRLVHLGNLESAIINGQMEKLEGADILMIPVGGGSTIKSKQAVEIISQLEPRIVIPMCYNIPGLKLKNKIESVGDFCKEIGVCPKEELNKYKISKKDLPQNDLQVVILKP